MIFIKFRRREAPTEGGVGGILSPVPQWGSREAAGGEAGGLPERKRKQASD